MGYVMLLTVMVLCGLGLVTLFSIANPQNDPKMYAFAVQQARFMALGAVACVIFACIDYHVLLRYAPAAVLLAVLLLALCFVPGIGKATNGASRWINVVGFSFQPSELAKISLILFLAAYMSSRNGNSRDFLRGFLVPSVVTGIIALPIQKSPDLGTTLLVVLIFMSIMFAAGARPVYLISMVFVGMGYILYSAVMIRNRWERILAFLNPEDETFSLGRNYQVLQGLIALGSGGMSGVGLGMSRQKMSYLPECHTDFIFPIIGEELGMFVTLGVVLAYFLFAICGCWIAVHAPDNGGFFLGIGITCLITLQAMMNMFVVTNLMPNKGLPLPFISYGGTSLLFSLIAVGILFNLHRQGIAGEKPGNSGVVLPERSSPRM